MLWNRLSVLYGKQWETNSGSVGGNTYLAWEAALTELTEAHVMRGYEALLAESNDFPPNLIKFMRLCRTAPHTSHQTVPNLSKPKPRYSVMRIEQAKQQLLTGRSFKIPKSVKHVIDWDRDDEKTLRSLLATWDEASGLDGLNNLIDHHEFSHGKQRNNAYVL